jgi:hypothetical protein
MKKHRNIPEEAHLVIVVDFKAGFRDRLYTRFFSPKLL